jgi:hypothetical protein
MTFCLLERQTISSLSQRGRISWKWNHPYTAQKHPTASEITIDALTCTPQSVGMAFMINLMVNFYFVQRP